jgi:hypothetical protein
VLRAPAQPLDFKRFGRRGHQPASGGVTTMPVMIGVDAVDDDVLSGGGP